MKIILKKDYDLLGDQGQILEVKNGYARNYLIPNGIATIANESNLKSFQEIGKQRAKKIQKQVGEAQKIAETLSAHTVTIEVKTGEDDRIFGSVTSQMIYDKLKENGFEEIDRKKIILKEPIKSLGEHELDIKLQSSVVAKLKINVVRESEKTEIVSEEIEKEKQTGKEEPQAMQEENQAENEKKSTDEEEKPTEKDENAIETNKKTDATA